MAGAVRTSAAATPARRASRRAAGRAALLLGLAALVPVAAFLSLVVGANADVGPAQAWGALFTFDGSAEHAIVIDQRVPRTVLALAAGLALAVSGAVSQALTRNDLGSPDLLGVTTGAALGAVLAITVAGASSPSAYVWAALAGALVVGAIVLAAGLSRRGGLDPLRTVLAGAVVTLLLGSWITAIQLLDERTLGAARFWLAGAVDGRELTELAPLLALAVPALLLAALLPRQLDALALGDDAARGLGQRIGLVRVASAACVLLLCGTAVAAAGPIAFVALAVPHIARRVVGPSHVWLLPACALLGPVFLTLADVGGRIVARPAEVEVGIMTALLGAPVLLHLVRRATPGSR